MGITLNKILNRKQLQPVWMEVGSVRYNVQVLVFICKDVNKKLI
jgi:hypothetical protein